MTLLNIPATLTAGDSLSWQDTLADYPASAWDLKWRLAAQDGSGSTIDLAAVGSGSTFTTSAASGVSAGWVPGRYTWVAWVQGVLVGTTVHTLASGTVNITPALRLAVAGQDNRSPARQALDEADAMLRAYGQKAYLQAITVGDRARTFRSPGEFLAYRSKLQAEVNREDDAARLAAGLPTRNRLLVRFGARRG